MKVIHRNQTKEFKNSDVCIAVEYPLGDEGINGAVVKLSGRYPDEGRVVNQECKELAFITEGSGTVVVEGEAVKLEKGDMVLIEPGEKYFWEGNVVLFVASSPAWYPEQHLQVD